jgi:ABC-type multidrug transport system ATPase subunit
MKAVLVENLRRKYGGKEALKGLGFEVDYGEVFGIIGPDGAGKTTLFRILATLLLADTGTAVVDGSDVVRDYKAIRRKVGYMPGRFSLYQDLTVEENLKVFAAIFKTTIEENYHLIEGIYKQIEPFRTRRAGNLSGGMKQKLALSCALIHKPVVLFLDEPTTGVDPVSRKELWEMLARLKEEGITILVSTPYMDEARRCDRIALIKDGTFLSVDTPENMIGQYRKALWEVSADHMSQLLADLRAHQNVLHTYAFGNAHHVVLDPDDLQQNGGILTAKSLQAYLQKRGHTGIHIEPIVPTIEDCFMELAD